MLSWWDFLIVLVIVVLVFGTRRVGHALRALKAGGRELKRGYRGDDKLPPPR